MTSREAIVQAAALLEEERRIAGHCGTEEPDAELSFLLLSVLRTLCGLLEDDERPVRRRLVLRAMTAAHATVAQAWFAAQHLKEPE